MVESVEMTIEGVHELAFMLCSNKELRSLSLNNNQIGEKGMNLLADALQCNKSLEHLYLNNCNLKDECVPLIMDIMKQNTTLTSIELVKNDFTEHGKMVLKEGHILNKTCSLYLDFTFH
jgi:Ran GTPase-activating protein (RanGAP) involved in mRNA processing and transport